MRSQSELRPGSGAAMPRPDTPRWRLHPERAGPLPISPFDLPIEKIILAEFDRSRAKLMERRSKVTMADVAELAGCSQATVSVVLNETDNVRISKDTKDSVRAAAKKLGYELQKRNRQTVSPSSRPLAVYVNRFANTSEVPLAINGAREICLNDGRSLLVAQGINDPVMESDAIEMLLSRNPIGLVYSEMTTKPLVPPKVLRDAKVPIVLVNCYTPDDTIPCVLPDEYTGGRSVGDFLVSQGHEKIAVITGETWVEASPQRLSGLRDALESHGLTLRPEYVLYGNWQTSSGYHDARLLLELDDPPTAIACQNDKIALGAYLYAKEKGIRIPQDLSIIGYDDEEICRHINPPLTTVSLPLREMGRLAADFIVSGNMPDEARTMVPCPLVRRSSVASAR